MFSVPRFPNRSLCFGLERRNGRTLASDRGPYATAVTKPVRPIPTRPPAARFLSRERNRGKSAAGVFPCTPGAQGAEAKGAKARRGKSGRYMCLCAADYTAGSARLLFRVPFATPAQAFDLSRRRRHPRTCHLVPLFRAELPSPVLRLPLGIEGGGAPFAVGEGFQRGPPRNRSPLAFFLSPVSF